MGSCPLAALLLSLLISYEHVIQGRVETADGIPVAAVKVVASRLSPASEKDEREIAITDERGEFLLKIAGHPSQSTSWHLLALKGEDYGTFDRIVKLPSDDGKEQVANQDAEEPFVVQLRRGKILSGTVYHEVTRQPVPLARLYTSQGQFARTDKQGRFEFHGVPAGVQRIMVKSAGKATRMINVDLAARSTAEVDIFLSPGAIVRGIVLDQDGQPVANATIKRIGSGPLLLQYPTAITADDGRFDFDDFPTRRMMMPLQVSARGYEERNDDMFATASADQPLELKLSAIKVEREHGQPQLMAGLAGGVPNPKDGKIRGRVTNPRGQPVRNFSVEFLLLSNLEHPDRGEAPASELLFTQDDGRFVVGNLEASKRYRVAVSAPGFGRADVEPIYAAESTKEEIEFRLVDPYSVTIKVSDDTNQQGIPDAMVGLSARYFGNGAFEWDYRLHDSRMDRTDSQGQVAFEKLPMKEARLFVQKAGYVRYQQVWNDNGKPVEIVLQPEARIRVSLKLNTPRVISGLNIKFRTKNAEVCYARSGDNSSPPVIRMDQLLPGECSLELYDGFAAEPWNAVLTRKIDLKQGDNAIEMDVP